MFSINRQRKWWKIISKSHKSYKIDIKVWRMSILILSWGSLFNSENYGGGGATVSYVYTTKPQYVAAVLNKDVLGILHSKTFANTC